MLLSAQAAVYGVQAMRRPCTIQNCTLETIALPYDINGSFGGHGMKIFANLAVSCGITAIAMALLASPNVVAQSAPAAETAKPAATTPAPSVTPAPKPRPRAAASAGCTVKSVNYKGWRATQLSNKWVTLEIVPQIGGRLMQVVFGGHDLLYINP